VDDEASVEASPDSGVADLFEFVVRDDARMGCLQQAFRKADLSAHSDPTDSCQPGRLKVAVLNQRYVGSDSTAIVGAAIGCG
jgi:hypothetical protein